MSNQEKTPEEEIATLRSEAADWRRKLRAAETERDTALAEIESLKTTHATEVTTLKSTITGLEEKVTASDKAKEQEALVAQVAQEKGVPATALRGSTKEELEAHADLLKPLITPTTPVVPNSGSTPDPKTNNDTTEFVSELFGETN